MCKIKKYLTEYPAVLEQWHHEKNEGVDFNKLTDGSHKKVWWICKSEHEWITSVKHRCLRKQGCPYCCGNKPDDFNNLAVTHPAVAKQWNIIKNGTLTPYHVKKYSNCKVWWKCSSGHEWQAIISNYVKSNYTCPFCEGNSHFLSDKTSLFGVAPLLAKELHPTKNGVITSKDIFAYSPKGYWWKCNKGHEWKTSPNNRHYTNCPYCQSYKGEAAISHFLTKGNYKFQPQYRDARCVYKRRLAFDFAIWINNKMILVEFQGQQHYEYICFSKRLDGNKVLDAQKHKDYLKRKFCKENNIALLEIKYDQINQVERLLSKFILSQENT